MGAIKKVSDTIKRRDEVAKNATPALAARAQQIKKLMDEGSKGALKRIWAVGKLIKDLPNHEDKYGQRPVEQVSVLVGHGRDFLYQAAHFFSDFDETQLAETLDLTTARGTVLTWMHVQRVLAVDDRAVRSKLLKAWADNDWELDEFNTAVDKALGRTKEGRHAGGRKLTIPGSLAGRLANMEKIYGIVIRNNGAIYSHPTHGIYPSIESMPADQITPALIAQIDANRKLLDQLEIQLGGLIEEMGKAKAIALVRMAAQAKLTAGRDVDKLDPQAGGKTKPGAKTTKTRGAQ